MYKKTGLISLTLTITITIALLIFFAFDKVHSQNNNPSAYINILVLDFGHRDHNVPMIKFRVESITSGNRQAFSLYEGRIITLPLEQKLDEPLYLFDRANLGIAKEEERTYAGNLKIIERHPSQIKLPLGIGSSFESDKSSYSRNESVSFTLKAFNIIGKNITLDLSSAQQFDIVVKNARGETVRRWSDGKMFITLYQAMIFAPRETKVFTWVWDQKDDRGNPVPPGVYTAEGSLATIPPYPAGAGRIRFEIK